MDAALKDLLTKLVDDLEKTSIALYVLQSGSTGGKAQTTKELAFGENQEFYSSLRKQIDALK